MRSRVPCVSHRDVWIPVMLAAFAARFSFTLISPFQCSKFNLLKIIEISSATSLRIFNILFFALKNDTFHKICSHMPWRWLYHIRLQVVSVIDLL